MEGARLWYEEAGTGPALVLLHGHLIDSGQWDSQLGAFASAFRTVRYDARGFGRSEASGGQFAFAEDLRGLLHCLGIERTALIGCSGGGATAIDFALVYPELVDALVLLGSALPGYRPDAPPPPALLERHRALERGDRGTAVEMALRFSTDGTRRPGQVDADARERTREMMLRQAARPDPAASARWAVPQAAPRLSEIGAPTLVLVGEHDVAAMHEIADLVAREVPGARRAVIPDGGHHANMEHPDLFNNLVLGFLRER